MSSLAWFSRLAILLGVLVLILPKPGVSQGDRETGAKSDKLSLYEQNRAQYPDDVEGHWALAEWCKQQGLIRQRKRHLRRILELDPDHAEARRSLHYFRYQDHWLTREQYMTGRGYVRYRGRWVLPQEKELLAAKQRQSVATKHWMRKVKLWISYREDRREDLKERGLANLRAIDDPAALPALDELLGQHEQAWYRLLLIEILSNIDDPEVTSQLVARSLTDPSDEVRDRAVELLTQRDDPDALVKFKRALHSKENEIVRRAAAALGEFDDISVVPTLIEALATTHKVQVAAQQPSGYGFSSTTTRLVPLGNVEGSSPGTATGPIALPATSGIGLSYGGKAPTMARVEIQNNEALFALNKLTGKNFGFNKENWRLYWETHRRQNQGAPVLQPQRSPSPASLLPPVP